MFWANATDQPCGVFQNIVRESTFEKTRTYPSHRWIGTRVSIIQVVPGIRRTPGSTGRPYYILYHII